MNDAYAEFLARKAVRAPERGLTQIPSLAKHLFPFQIHCVEHALRCGSAGNFLDTGLGKAQPTDELILTPEGPRAIGSLALGDYVIGRDGQPTRITGIFPQGNRPAYRVTFTDGAVTRCDIEHLWAVRTKVQKYRSEPFRVLTLRQIIADGLISQEGWRYFVPMPEPIAFDGEPLPIDPYLLGVLLGDGYLSEGGPRITSADQEILDAVSAALPEGVMLRAYGGYDWGITGGRQNGGHRLNPLQSFLKSLGLTGKRAESKFVPSIYKFSATHDRIRLLQGLLDTDGHVRPQDNNVEFCSVSKQLASDVVFIVRSLGGRAAIREHKTPRQLAYRMSICLPDFIMPFALSRKASVYRPRPKYKPARAICSIEPCGNAEMICIRVAASDSLYITADCIVTHNTEVQLEWCKHALEATNGRALVLTPLAVAGQFQRRAERWGYESRVVREQSEVRSGISICNYDRLDKLDPSAFGAVALDEASILKSFGGKTATALIEAFKHHRFRLAATATPAPNDHMELGNYADFLSVMQPNEMLSRFFINDTSTASQQWRLKGHAVDAFWQWVASWARAAEKPSDLGDSDEGFILPPFKVLRHRARDSQIEGALADMFGTVVMSATTLHDVKRQTIDARAETAAALVEAEPNEAWIIWADTDYEADVLRRVIPKAIEVRGSQSIDEKEDKLRAFSLGGEKRIIGKPSMIGLGLDWAHCARMVFVGRSFSYETWYQAVRRCWRFGQKREVHVHLVVAEGESEIGRVIDRKSADHVTMKRAMRAAMSTASAGEARMSAYSPNHKMSLPSWMTSAA